MILEDGTDTREEVKSPGPYCDGMAVVLNHAAMNGSFGDFEATIPDLGEGAAAYGRRVLWWTSTGFMSTTRYATPEEAINAICADYPDEGEE